MYIHTHYEYMNIRTNIIHALLHSYIHIYSIVHLYIFNEKVFVIKYMQKEHLIVRLMRLLINEALKYKQNT